MCDVRTYVRNSAHVTKAQTYVTMAPRRIAAARRGPAAQQTHVGSHRVPHYTMKVSHCRFWSVCFVVLFVLVGGANAFQFRHHHRRARQHQSKIRRVAALALENHASDPFTILYSNVYRAVEGTGVPSSRGWRVPYSRGWKSDRLDRLSNWSVAEESNRPVICEYEPNGFWLWTKWRGTVLQLTYRAVLITIAMGAAIDFWARSVSDVSWPLIAVPPSTDPLITSLEGLRKMWGYQLTLGTFVLTFFTSQAYEYWKKVYDTARAIQGRINDICMLLTIGAQRGGNITNTMGSTGYSAKASKFVKVCTRLIRVSHTFFWAATPTISNGLSDCEEYLKDAENCTLPIDDAHIGPLLLSPYGIRALVQTGQLTTGEVQGLVKTGLPPSQYAYVLLVWVGLYSMNGMKDGTLCCDSGFEENLMRQLTALRGEYFNVDDFRAGRMPVAYVQLMQVLIDSLVVLAPFALYPELGSLSIPMAALLTLFFKGLLELSKSFLDPFGVEGNTGQNIRVDVLVSELNYGANSRWVKAGAVLPNMESNSVVTHSST